MRISSFTCYNSKKLEKVFWVNILHRVPYTYLEQQNRVRQKEEEKGEGKGKGKGKKSLRASRNFSLVRPFQRVGLSYLILQPTYVPNVPVTLS